MREPGRGDPAMQGFLLTRHWRDKPGGIELELWLAGEAGPVQMIVEGQEAVFFIRQSDWERICPLLDAARGERMARLGLRSFRGEPLAAVYCRHQRGARALLRQLQTRPIPAWEADIRPPERFLMERFITGGVEFQGQFSIREGVGRARNPHLSTADYRPALKVVSIDIETSMDAQELYSIAAYSDSGGRVFMCGDATPIAGARVTNQSKHHIREADGVAVPGEVCEDGGTGPEGVAGSGGAALGTDVEIVWCDSARSCLQKFFAWLAEFDPDILIGWNLVQFDLWVMENLCQRLRIAFELGRDRRAPHWRREADSERRYIGIAGRVALDGIDLLKTAAYRFESYSLQAVSTALLGTGKLLDAEARGDEITALFHRDKRRLAAYNLRDCELVWDIFEREKLLDFALERARLTGLALDRVGGSVAAFEYAYLPRLHRRGYVAPNLGEQDSDVVSPGGYVLDSRPGLYQDILVLDFKSLYPSIIRSFNIDPAAFWHAEHRHLNEADCVPGFNGARFARGQAILPEIIAALWAAREQAKTRRNAPLSHAIKIIMNSFYGVLGSPGCRFFDPRISSSITLRGHEIIQRSRDWIERQGYKVIYGDTDSVFVWIDRSCDSREAIAIGKSLQEGLNAWWRARIAEEFGAQSALEVEFETHYRHFFMPTIRGSEQGSKKRYAGLVERQGKMELVFKGLENVRTDWTMLARKFQEALYLKVFLQQPIEEYVRTTCAEVLSCQRDPELVYRKRLSRHLDEYKKNIPPHVQAARKLRAVCGITVKRGDWVSYVVSINGPEPVEFMHRGIASPLDYQLYVDRQLAPVADSILHFIDNSFAQIVDRQLPLF